MSTESRLLPEPVSVHSTTPRSLGWIAIVVVLGCVMSVLDTTIVNVALSQLAHKFSTSLATIQWIATGYLLALATVIPLTGWASDRFGSKRVYMASITLFLFGSALSGIAWSASSLIVFRVVQGLGGGMIIPVGMTILTRAAGPARIGRAMGIVGVPVLLAPIFGPILGGYFVDDLSWRWIFLINIPIGAAALLAAGKTLVTDSSERQYRLDWEGLFLICPGLSIFVYGLTQAAARGGVNSPTVLGCVAVGVLLAVAFVRRSRHRQDALIAVDLFADRTIATAAITIFLFGGVFFATTFLMPLYFQMARGQSALDAGLLLAIQGVGTMLTMPIAGRLTDRMGAGKVVPVGLMLFTAATFYLTHITSSTPFRQIEIALFILGLGTGASIMPTISAALASLEPAAVARGSSALNVLLRVGGSVGTALFAVVLSHELARVPPSVTGAELRVDGHFPPASAAISSIGAAFGHTFLWSLATVALALLVSLRLPRTGGNGRAEAITRAND